MKCNFDCDVVLAEVKRGSSEAFERLCGTYDPLIRSMAERYSRMTDAGDSKLREDFVQDARLALYSAAMNYNPGDVTFGLYAKICIRNALVSELRRIERKRRAEIKAASVGTLVHEDVLSEFSADTAKYLELMSPFERQVLELYVDGLKVGKIASKLGRSSKSVSNAVYRIKEKLKSASAEKNDYQPKGL